MLSLLWLLGLWVQPLVAQATSSLPSYRAQFTQERSQPFLKRPFRSQGQMVFWQGQGILWTTEKPLAQVLLINPQGLFKLDAGERSPLISPQAGQALVAGLLLPLFSGQLMDLAERFELQWKPLKTGRQLTARPKDPGLAAQLDQLQVRLDPQDRLVEVQLTEAKGGQTTIRFSGVTELAQPTSAEQALFSASERQP
ncbi:MAG: outer membrane lipoprotein carrier protein LolA [bacterium]|nr:outer membrane lipoprotein carrier protein LolA [bacterium]